MADKGKFNISALWILINLMLNVFHHILYLFVALINTNLFCIHAQITVSFYISYFVNFLLSATV